jgi:hypothetical protein
MDFLISLWYSIGRFWTGYSVWGSDPRAERPCQYVDEPADSMINGD